MPIRLRQVFLAGILFFSAFLMQGCSVLAWIGAICADVVRCSDVEFESFADWWATVLGQATDRHVISPAEVASHLPANVLTQMTQSTTDQDDIALAPQVSRDIQTDAVLFGRVVSKPPQKGFWGSKDRYPKRLYLHLISAEGTLLWKVELPFAVVKGTKEVDEEIVKRILLTHVRTHAKELRWTELGLGAVHTGS
jgi:hypothetical protein